jgi:hypothetical protein
MARSQENSNATDHHDRSGSSSATGFVRLGQRQALETVIHWAEPPPSPQSTGAISLAEQLGINVGVGAEVINLFGLYALVKARLT